MFMKNSIIYVYNVYYNDLQILLPWRPGAPGSYSPGYIMDRFETS
jgi:hypothetical protein